MSPTPRSKAHRPSPEEKLVASLIRLMEAGTTPWRRPWDGSGGGHHVNLISGRRYRGSNPVLLGLGMHLRGSSLPYWCGFAEARAQGLVPRRGCQAVHVLRPQLLRQSPADGCAAGDPSGGGAATGELATVGPAADRGTRLRQQAASASGRPVVLYRPVAVFNAADLQGERLAALIRARRTEASRDLRPEPQRLESAEAVLGHWPVPVIRGGDHACYRPDADRIHLPVRAAFHSAAAAVATWAHEAIHSTGHPSRLGRDLSGVMGADDGRGRAYAREELVAELGAVLLGDRLEIGSDTAHHAAYLAHWITLLRESPKQLLMVLGDARRAADLICPEPRAESGPERAAAGAAATVPHAA